MATVREWLNELGFDWDNGTIVHQPVENEGPETTEILGVEVCANPPGSRSPLAGNRVERDDLVLDREFDDGYGLPACPRFVAKDREAIYFPVQYDGSTRPARVLLDMRRYIGDKGEIADSPYPGG